jgi:hypothetical protein
VSMSIVDVVGHSASTTVGPINIDKTAPALTLPNITLNATSLSGASATYSGASASDGLSGFAGGSTAVPTCNPPSGSNFAPGSSTTVNCSATDLAGNTANGSFTVAVNPFYFVGFYQPIDNQPVLNQLRGGQTVPVKWRLYLSQGGAEITDVGSVMAEWPRYTTVTCDTNQPVAEVETVSSGNTTLRYDGQQFVYNWQTPNAANTCLRLDVKFTDNQVKSANFKLR